MKVSYTTLILAVLFATALPAFAHEEATASAPLYMMLIMRWMHILAAVIMLGGSTFIYLVLTPALSVALPDDQRAEVSTAIRSRWKLFIPWLIGAFLISGFYNYLMVTRHLHDGADNESLYHMLFGIKFLLSLVVFLLISFMVGRTSIAQRMQANSGTWMGITIALAIVVVLIGGYMKVM